MYMICRKAPLGLVICFLWNAIFEIIKTCYSMGENCYRLLIFRYIFAIAYGCFMSINENRLRKTP